VARNMGLEAWMVDNATQIAPAWLSGKKRVGVTAGASAPEVLVKEVPDWSDSVRNRLRTSRGWRKM
jgi:4-hydroxy-3-methylbut-2-enyl diphosphate reductase